MQNFINIPQRNVGPIKIVGLDTTKSEIAELVEVPLATLETPLWPSVSRGASVSRLTAGINAVLIHDGMTRSVLLEAESAAHAQLCARDLSNKIETLREVVITTSNYARLKDLHTEIVGSLLFVRFNFASGDAAGHNMTTKAADALLKFILSTYPHLNYVSVSGNICVDKKVSAINGILGRGKNVVAEILISEEICKKHLKATAEAICEINFKKNFLGSVLAGSLRSANAHYANMLLAIYLATGQDAANIVEGSQGITYANIKKGELYFSVTLPNIIVGTVGAGKNLDFARENLQQLGCLEKRADGENACRLAKIVAATVLCGELSLLAALTNQGELVKSHVALERK
jgi:hydroxymethylglutaryl-CoA reductase (NADPH)